MSPRSSKSSRRRSHSRSREAHYGQKSSSSDPNFSAGLYQAACTPSPTKRRSLRVIRQLEFEHSLSARLPEMQSKMTIMNLLVPPAPARLGRRMSASDSHSYHDSLGRSARTDCSEGVRPHHVPLRRSSMQHVSCEIDPSLQRRQRVLESEMRLNSLVAQLKDPNSPSVSLKKKVISSPRAVCRQSSLEDIVSSRKIGKRKGYSEDTFSAITDFCDVSIASPIARHPKGQRESDPRLNGLLAKLRDPSSDNLAKTMKLEQPQHSAEITESNHEDLVPKRKKFGRRLSARHTHFKMAG